MKKIALFVISIFSFCILQAQTRYTGYLYTYQTGIREKFEFFVSTYYSESAYRTMYRLFRPGAKKNRYTITASHFKELKKVVVEVNDEQYILTTMTGKDETNYGRPTLKPFGFRGNLAILDKSAPNQLIVQFLSDRYEYVRVLSFLGSSADDLFQYFIFNEGDAIPESKDSGPAVLNGKGDRKKPKAVFHRAISSADSSIHE